MRQLIALGIQIRALFALRRFPGLKLLGESASSMDTLQCKRHLPRMS
jgi:hypothetical protein